MDASIILSHLKARLGISTNIRDDYFTARTNAAINEIEKQGITLDGANMSHVMLVVDYAAWMYENAGAPESMPRHIQCRIHNLTIATVASAEESS